MDKLEKNQAPSSYAWVVLIIIFLASMSAPLHMFKVPPVMPALVVHFGLELDEAGLLMSMFAIIGVVLALPAGLIIGKMGVRTAALLAFAALIGGSIIGACASSFYVLLASRVLEGIGMCFMSIIAPTVISAWFAPNHRALPMGIWATWVPVATITIFVVAPILSAQYGWARVWWACTAFTAIIAVLFFVFFKMPTTESSTDKMDFGAAIAIMGKVMAIPGVWGVSFIFLAYNFLSIALSTFIFSYLKDQLNYSLNESIMFSTIFIVVNMVGVILGGAIGTYLDSRKKSMIFPFIALIGLMPFAYPESSTLSLVMLNVVVFFCGLAIGPTFAAAPEIAGKPEYAGTALAVLAVGQNLGMFAGPFLYGLIAKLYGWPVAGYSVIPLLILALLVASRLRLK